MPQIIPGATTSSTQTTQAPPAQNQTQNWGGDNPWGWNPPGAVSPSSDKKLTPQERVEMIEKVYSEILDRKPDTRDINYYKYSTLSEDEIRKQLITGKEHKQLMQDGRDYKKMKERALTSETRVSMLESQIKDQVEEFKQLSELLNEKNRYIKQLREDLNSPYNLIKTEPQPTTPVTSQPQVSQHVFTSPEREKKSSSETKTFKSFLRSILKNILND